MTIKQSINGILLLNKPCGISSNQALQKVKRIFHAQKAGHTGTLDPLASGLLPVCFGEATKFSQYLLQEEKTYQVKAKLGMRTTTSDSEGEVVAKRVVPTLTRQQINQAAEKFRGTIEQIPSMYSALKYQGQPLYKYARQGKEVPRPARKITIFNLVITNYQNQCLEFEVHCSKGTYVRTLVDDLGETLGCGAHVTALHRTQVGAWTMMHSFAEIEAVADPKSLLLPMVAAVADLPKISVTSKQGEAICYGQSVKINSKPQEHVALFINNEKFIGVGEIKTDFYLKPRRLIGNPLSFI